jgi:serine/threonine-protein kinase HipA
MSILSIIANQRKLGSISYEHGKLSFQYEPSWNDWADAFDLSVSMPLSSETYGHDLVEPYLWGLLPDNNDILKQYGKQFHVSSRNVFRLLEHVGQDCPGAIQFISEQDEDELLGLKYQEDVEWITKDGLDDLIVSIKANKGLQRTSSSQGQFSLAGAQPKTALYKSITSGEWGIPKGLTPTTHILKPAVGEYAGFAENEHYCLRLAEAVGMDVAKSSVIMCADIPVIVVERYDRFFDNDVLLRIHQEDMCQARSVYPDLKYENEGGPTVANISETIWDNSDDAYEDITKFADALLFNYLVIGTDAHAKNYSLLHLASQRTRLTPLYDMVSALPYPSVYNPFKTKLAMKIGSEYILRKIEQRHWEACAKQLKLKPEYLLNRLNQLAESILKNAKPVAEKLHQGGLDHPIIDNLASTITERAEKVLSQ